MSHMSQVSPVNVVTRTIKVLLSGDTQLQLLGQQEELRQPVLLLCRDGELLLQTETLLHQLRSIRDPGSQQRNSILLTRVYN